MYGELTHMIPQPLEMQKNSTMYRNARAWMQTVYYHCVHGLHSGMTPHHVCRWSKRAAIWRDTTDECRVSRREWLFVKLHIQSRAASGYRGSRRYASRHRHFFHHTHTHCLCTLYPLCQHAKHNLFFICSVSSQFPASATGLDMQLIAEAAVGAVTVCDNLGKLFTDVIVQLWSHRACIGHLAIW